MSEKITTEEQNQNTSTKWDSLAEAAVDIKAPVEEITEANAEAGEAIDIQNINFEELNQDDIANLESALGNMLAKNTKEIYEYQKAIEAVKKRQLLISQIIHSLAELKELNQEMEEFPFVKKAEAPAEEAKAEAPAKKKSAIELYEEMLEKRVNSGDLDREEADALYEKAQAKIKEHQATEAPAAETPAAEAPAEEPAKDQEENIDWADWRGMSREDWERYEARSKAHDAENLANIARRDPDLAEAFRKELNAAEEAPAEETKEESVEAAAETTAEVDDIEAKKAELQKQIEEDEALEDEIRADIEALKEKQSMQEFLEAEGEESSDSAMPNFLKIKNADIKAKELSDMIRQQYSIIGGQRGMLLLSSQFEGENVGSAAYGKWWNELTEEGRAVVDELVDFAEENEIPQYAQESPINGGFLAWYKANAKHNG